MIFWLRTTLDEMGLAADDARLLAAILGLLITLVLGYALFLLATRVMVAGFRRSARTTRMAWDDLFVEHGVPRRVASVVPLLAVYVVLPAVLTGYSQAIDLLRSLDLLGGHVAGSPQRLAGRRQVARAVHLLRQAEVGHPR